MRAERLLRPWILTVSLAMPVAAAGQPQPGPEAWALEAASAAAHAAREAARALAQAMPVPPPPPSAPSPGPGEVFTDRLVRVLKVPPGVTVVVQNFAGNVAVSAGQEGEVRLQATRRARGQRDESAAISIEQRAGRVEIGLPRHRGSSSRYPGPTVDLDLVVPPGATLDVRSVSGDVSVAGVRGAINAESVSGHVTATGLAGTASLKSVSGDVLVTASAIAGDVTVNSVSGDVTAKGLRARGVTAATVSGNVALVGSTCTRAVIKSISGRLEVSGALAKGARYELKSHSGDVRLVLDGKTGFELEASTWSGSLTSELPLQTMAAGDTGEPARRRTLQGVFGDGSARIDITSFSGAVSITRAK